MLQRRAGGLVVRTRTVKAVHNRSRIHDIALANEPIGIPISRRARLMGASAIAGGTLRGLAVAAGMVTVFGGARPLRNALPRTPASPAPAQPQARPAATPPRSARRRMPLG